MTDKHAPYCYVSRWYDENGIPHYFGIYSNCETLAKAKKEIRFNIIAVEPDIVYKAIDVDDMYAYLSDVLVKQDINNDDIGSIDWVDNDD